MSQYVYIRSEPNLFTVGFHTPDGTWEPESDYNSREDAASRVAELNGCPRFDSWTPTPEKINALPDPIRSYIHQLATNADPPSMVRENVLLKDTIKALEKKSTIKDIEINELFRIELGIFINSDDLRRLIEWLESKGMTVKKIEES